MEIIYLDNVIILCRGVDESLDWLALVFKCLHSYGFKLKLPKCHLLREEVLFLVHIVRGDRIGPNSALVRDVQLWEPPCQSCKLFSGYATTTASLFQLLQNWQALSTAF